MKPTIMTVNYKALEKNLYDLDATNPERTKSHLDIMKDNFAKNAFEILDGDSAILEIDHAGLHISKLGEELKGEYNGIPDSRLPQSKDEIFYENVVQAMEQAKELGVYEEIFTEISPTR